MRRTGRPVLLLVVVGAAILLASGVALAAVIDGTDNADTLNGTDNADTINGYGGGDTISGRGGPDEINGGNGQDTISGGGGGDTLSGGDEPDEINGGDGQDTLEGNEGDDTLDGGADADDIRGNRGDDTLKGSGGRDTIFGGDDADEIDGGDGDDILNGEGGKDSISGGANADQINGGEGNDDLSGGGDADAIDGGQGKDIVRGEEGQDQVNGGDGDDDVGDIVVTKGKVGGVYAGRGPDTVDGGQGKDRLVASYPLDEAAQDTVHGDSEDDHIDVANRPASKDVVDCGTGQDRVTKDRLDVVADDCEDVKTADERAQQSQAEGRKSAEAVAAFERHMTVGSNGLLTLDKEGLNQETIDSVYRDLLEQALNRTNNRIGAGEATAADVFPHANARRVPISLTGSAAGVVALQVSSTFSDPWDGQTFTLTPDDLTIIQGILGGVGTATGLAAFLELNPSVTGLATALLGFDIAAIQILQGACGAGGVEFTAAVDPNSGVPLGTRCA